MPLAASEIVPGSVAYFDHTVLLSEPGIDRNDDGLNRPGPFACVQVVGNKSVWCAITTQWNPKRLLIDKAWRSGGDPKWQTNDQYLVDGLNTYVGPNDAFLRAAAAERPFTPHTRPAISVSGITAILAEVATQGGPVL